MHFALTTSAIIYLYISIFRNKQLHSVNKSDMTCPMDHWGLGYSVGTIALIVV